MSSITVKRWKRAVLSTLLVLPLATCLAQVTQIGAIDVLGGINAGTIVATTQPELVYGALDKIFDGNGFTSGGVQNSATLTVTLLFDSALVLKGSKVFFWMEGLWSLEAAGQPEDLLNRSGSYQLLVDRRACHFFTWDSVSFSSERVRVVRLSGRNTQSDSSYAILGEWVLYSGRTLVGLRIVPSDFKMVPGTSLQVTAKTVDSEGRVWPYTFPTPVAWSSSNPDVAYVGEMGDVHAVAVGSCDIVGTSGPLTGTTRCTVVEDFVAEKVQPMVLPVAVVLQDQIIDKVNKRRIHQVRGWADPLVLVYQLVEEFYQCSDGVIQYQIVEIHDDVQCFSRLDGKFMSLDTLAYYFGPGGRLYGRTTPGTLQYMAEIEDRVKFDYAAMIDYHHFDQKRNEGRITEVWVYTFPFGGMWESQLIGPGAFWYNSPPMNHPGLRRLLPVMGWNYERGIAEALESYGHRSESALAHTYGRWDPNASSPNNWEIYTTIDKIKPGQAHVGNIHYPPNGMSDYDFGNHRYVTTYADNWKRYPILLDQTRVINCSEWGCSHLGYMRWWYSHLPRFVGVTDGILNNWWHYIVDYEGAVEEAARQSSGVQEGQGSGLPKRYFLGQNYPNPFNARTLIPFSLAHGDRVRLKVYDALGREVAVLVDEVRAPGTYTVTLDGTALPSGIFFYELVAGSERQVHKCLLLR
ncbi:MAG: T9SS type A sorting domain-containing protein [candidate division KSB1 bacterium]|nr:T9SS type A sorting domain-containing protein [candidate division KSB1 bacterium]MDZ7392700.1 T9SS type A sorting domain-containing protein [candidate division KSB1 bacterium]